jgi:hypothetical protein
MVNKYKHYTKLTLCMYIVYFKQKNSYSAGQEIPWCYRTCKLIIMSTKAYHEWSNEVHIPTHSLSLQFSFSYYPPIYIWVSPSSLFLQVLQPKCMHFLVFPVCYSSDPIIILDTITLTILTFIGYASDNYDGACAGLLGSSTPSIAVYNINTISPKLKSDHQQWSSSRYVSYCQTMRVKFELRL